MSGKNYYSYLAAGEAMLGYGQNSDANTLEWFVTQASSEFLSRAVMVSILGNLDGVCRMLDKVVNEHPVSDGMLAGAIGGQRWMWPKIPDYDMHIKDVRTYNLIACIEIVWVKDITRRVLLNTPGIGPKSANIIMEWRERVLNGDYDK